MQTPHVHYAKRARRSRLQSQLKALEHKPVLPIRTLSSLIRTDQLIERQNIGIGRHFH